MLFTVTINVTTHNVNTGNATVGLINIATKTPAPVPLGEGLSIVLSKEWWNPVELELEFQLQYL